MSEAIQLHQFLSISIAAGPGVLVPRPETELLGRVGLDIIAPVSAPLVIDMCCGSGNLGLAIAHARPDARVLLGDLTDETVAQARANVDRLGLMAQVSIGQGDLFDGIKPLIGTDKADLVIANPPYISSGKLAGEAAHLLEAEPREAFDGGVYGIAIHQRLIGEAPAYLKPGGWLAFEFGLGQDRQVALLARRSNQYGEVRFAENDQGEKRVAQMQLLSQT